MARAHVGRRPSSAGYGVGSVGIGAAIRDPSVVANADPLAAALYRPLPWPVITPTAASPAVVDRRRWVPDRMVFSSGQAAPARRSLSKLSSYPFAFGFPSRVAVCVRRSQRREVLFARGRAGGRHRRPRWNASSYWRC